MKAVNKVNKVCVMFFFQVFFFLSHRGEYFNNKIKKTIRNGKSFVANAFLTNSYVTMIIRHLLLILVIPKKKKKN